ncbi:MAG: ATP-binding protein [Thermodesulfobacteriota bacterium]
MSLRHSNNMDGVLQNVDAAVLLIDNEHRIKWMNRAARALLEGAEIGEKRVCYKTQNIGKTVCDVCITGKTIDTRTPAHYEFSLPINNRQKNFEVLTLPVEDPSGKNPLVMEVVMEIKGKGIVKIKEKEMLAQIEKMAAIGQLAAGVAHELNTPLGTISIITDELERTLEAASGKKQDDDAIREYMNDLRGEITRCKGIIQDLLGFSKNRLSGLKETDINTVVSKTIDFARKGNASKKAAITLFLDKDVPKVITEPDRLRQVLFNVVNNAMEAVEDNKRGSVEIATSASIDAVSITVNDNGYGISEENIKRVMEPFFTTKPVGKGTGLGLYVSYSIMTDLNGGLKIESAPGKGTQVTLSLPKEFIAKSEAMTT